MRTTIQRKINQINLIYNSPSDEFISAISSFDKAFDSEDIHSSIEIKELALINIFISNFSALNETVKNIYTAIDSLDESFDLMLKKLSIGEKGVDEVLDMTSSLHTQQEKQKQQLNSINAFIDRYYLQKDDLETLSSGDISASFFDSFQKLEAAMERTKKELENNKTVCLDDAMNSLVKVKENAFQRIHTWLHMNSNIFDSVQPKVSVIYEKCLIKIKEKEFLFGFVVDEIAKVRGNVVGRAFLKALTTGDDVVKPIESKASLEPLQFVGDLFAWMHQTSATESSFLSNLLKEDQSSKIIKNSLSTIFDSLLRSLEIRVSQTIKSLVKPSDLYQVANICTYFSNVFGDICGLNSTVFKTIDKLKCNANDSFKKSINDSISDIKNKGRTSQGEISEALRTIIEITNLHKQSSLSSFDVGILIDQFVDNLREAVLDAKNSIPFQASTLYELSIVCKNSNLQCKSSILKESNELTQKIIDAEIQDVLNRCRISDILLLAESKKDQPLSLVAGLEKNILHSCIKRFEATLLGPGPIIMPLCDAIKNPELKHNIRRNILEQLTQKYEELFNIIMDPKNGYDSPNTMFKYTPALVHDMISV